MQWVIVGKDGIIVEVMEVVGVEGSRVLFERYLPLHDTVLKRYRVATRHRAPACRHATCPGAGVPRLAMPNLTLEIGVRRVRSLGPGVPRLKTLSSLPSKKTPCIRPPA